MTFEKTPRGTYGQKIPPYAGTLMKMLLPLMRWQVRRGDVAKTDRVIPVIHPTTA